MGMFFDLFGYGSFKSGGKKRCTICGCYMYSDSDSDICEICLDELYESDPGEPEDEELLYPSFTITNIINSEASEKFKEIVDRRVESIRR